MTINTQKTHKFLHWLSALLVISVLVLGYYMTWVTDYSLYHWHKSIAVIIAIVWLLRIVYRLYQPFQSTVQTSLTKWLHLYHWGLLILLAVMLLSGAFYSGFGGFGIAVFSWQLVASNYNEAGQAVASSAWLSDFGWQIHILSGYVLSAALSIHILAALKHHFIDKDATLKNML